MPRRRSRRHRKRPGFIASLLAWLTKSYAPRARKIEAGADPVAEVLSLRTTQTAATRHGRSEFVWPARHMLIAYGIMSLMMLWLGSRIISDTAAYNLAVSAPVSALRWESSEPTALNQLAYQTIINPEGDLNIAREYAQRALHFSPFDARAPMLLGLIAQREGEDVRAAELMRIAGSRSWRNRITQSWLFTQNVENQRFARALEHFDAIMRVGPPGTLEAQLFPVLMVLSNKPDGLAAIAEFLKSTPPWGNSFITSFAQDSKDPSLVDRLFDRLGSPQNAIVVNAHLNRLVREGRYADASRIWQRTLTPEQLSKTQLLFNSSFSLPIDGAPFNWQFTSARGAIIEIADTDGDRALRAQFSGARVSLESVGQLLVLPPGTYRFSGRMLAENLRTTRGVWWRVFCAGQGGETLGRTDLISGSLPWTYFNFQFVVPMTGCEAQWLRFENPARVPSEAQIDGELWFDSLKITRTAPKNANN